MSPGEEDGAPQELHHTPGAELRETCRRTTRAEFERAHPHLWLVRELQAATTQEPSFSTAFVAEDELRAGELPLERRIAAAPQGFGFVPLKKTGRNPWKDRILIGRATNNDVVLRDGSVSKVHARAVQREGAWVITDASSTNGTWVDGTQLAAGAASGALQSRAVVKFGHVSCTVLGSGEVYDALAGGARR